jgi:hypothetical protein
MGVEQQQQGRSVTRILETLMVGLIRMPLPRDLIVATNIWQMSILFVEHKKRWPSACVDKFSILSLRNKNKKET